MKHVSIHFGIFSQGFFCVVALFKGRDVGGIAVLKALLRIFVGFCWG